MKEHYFFDNAATTWPKPEAVYAFMDRFSRQSAVNPGRAGYALAVESQLMVQQTRRMLATFFGFAESADRVVFTLNASDSLNQLIGGLLRPGDHVITSNIEHNSVLRPLNHRVRSGELTVTRVPVDRHGYIDPEAIGRSITSATRLIIINHASNVIGAVQDLGSLGRISREHDVLLAVDAAQSAGVLPIDMARDQIDALVFTGHKGLFGPMGTGGLVVGERVELTPVRVGGTGVDSIDPYQPLDYPHRLEVGTVAVPGIAGLHAAQLWFRELGRQCLGRDNATERELCVAAVNHVHRHEMRLTQRITDALLATERVTVLGPVSPDQPRVATLSFIVDGVSSSAVGEMLDADHHVCVRTGLHCAPEIHRALHTLEHDGAVRIAPGFFTTDEEVEHLLDAINAICRQ